MRIGSKVKLNPNVTDFTHGRGNVGYDEVGKIEMINGEDVRIDFPSCPGWHGYTYEIVEINKKYKKTYCKDCGRLITKEEFENEDFEEIDGEYICRDCFDENYFICNNCNSIERREEGTYIESDDEMVCMDCLDRYYFFCEDCQEYHHENDGVSINSGYGDYYTICESCFENGDYNECEDCGDNFHLDYLYWSDRHDCYYCNDCESRHGEELYDYHEFCDWQLFKGENEEKPKYYIGKEIELEPFGYGKVSEVLEAIRNNINAVGMHDGSLEDGGVEVVTHPESWQYLQENKQKYIDFFDEIKELDYGDDGGCGLHFHVSRHSDEITSRVIVLLESFKEEIKKLSRRNGDFHWAKFLSDEDCKSNEVKYQSTKWLKDKYLKGYHDRYYALNLQNARTIEFRFFNGVNNFEEFWGALQFIHNIMELAFDEDRELNTITWKELLVGDELQAQAKKLGVLDIDKTAKDTSDIIEKYEIALRKAKEEIRGILRNLAKYVSKEISELDIREVKTNDIDKIRDKIEEFMSKISHRRQYLDRVMSLYNALDNPDNTLEMDSIKDYVENTKIQYPTNSERYKRYNRLIDKAIKNYESEVR